MALRVIDPRHHRCGLAKITAELDHLHALVSCGQLFQSLLAAVRAAIVDEDQLPWLLQLLQDHYRLLVKRDQIVGFVIHRHDNGNHEYLPVPGWHKQ
ncbi:hypothetical protein D3C78_1455810 [compost metagenome]